MPSTQWQLLEYDSGPGRVQAQAAFRGNARASAESGEEVATPLRGSEAPRVPPALRFSPGNGRRAEVMGGAQRPVTRSRRQAVGHAGRGSSGFLFRLKESSRRAIMARAR